MLYKKSFAALDWVTGEGHTAQTADLTHVTGTIKRIDLEATSVTDNPTFDATLSSVSSAGLLATLASFSTLADGTLHVKVSESGKGTPDADFNPIPCVDDTLRISLDPSADPGGVTQTLTITVTMFLEM